MTGVPRAVMLLVSSRALKVLSPICMLFVFGFGLRKGGVAASGADLFAVDDEDGADGSARGGGLCGWSSSRALKVLSPICMLFVFGFGLRKGGVAASGADLFAVDDEDGADGSARGGGLCG